MIKKKNRLPRVILYTGAVSGTGCKAEEGVTLLHIINDENLIM